MKKIFATLIVVIMVLSCMTVFASADAGLPFDITAPTNVAVQWLEGNDSPTTMSFSYSLPNEMTSFYKDLEEASANGNIENFLSRFDFTEIWSFVQIDWAIDDVKDSVSGWHCNEYWTKRGELNISYDEDWHIRTSEWDGVEIGFNNATETLQNVWIMRGVPDGERWNGNPETKTPGVKDQLRPEQYEYYEDNVHIDFTKHTAYFRARLVTVTVNDAGNKYYYSEWSPTVGYGKDIAKIEPMKPGEVDAPVITNLHMTDKEFNDNPVVAFTLTVPDKLQTQLTNAAALGGGIYIDTECRVKGDTEWTLMGNADWTVKPGEMECALLHLVNADRPTIPKDTVIELRCRYRCTATASGDEFFSEYSKIISFGTDDINSYGGEATDTTDNGSTGKKSDCWLCHFCPQPLGLCIFIWIAIIVLIIIIIIIIIVVASKKKKEKDKEQKQS